MIIQSPEGWRRSLVTALRGVCAHLRRCRDRSSPLTADLPTPVTSTRVQPMNSSDPPLQPPPSPGTELAKARNRAAEERTLMAWIRTCLSLISFGVGIDRIVAVLQRHLSESVNAFRLSRILGLSFIALGTVAMLAAALDHRYQLQRIQRNDLVYVSRRSAAFIVAAVLAGLGAIAFLGILVSMFIP